MNKKDTAFAAYSTVIRAIAAITGSTEIQPMGEPLPLSALAVQAGLLPLYGETRQAWVDALAEPDAGYVDQDHEPQRTHVFQATACHDDTTDFDRNDIQFMCLSANPVYATLADAQVYLRQLANEDRTESGLPTVAQYDWTEAHDGDQHTWETRDDEAELTLRVSCVPVR